MLLSVILCTHLRSSDVVNYSATVLSCMTNVLFFYLFIGLQTCIPNAHLLETFPMTLQLHYGQLFCFLFHQRVFKQILTFVSLISSLCNNLWILSMKTFVNTVHKNKFVKINYVIKLKGQFPQSAHVLRPKNSPRYYISNKRFS